jgi:DNA-binding NarL/FixJ family response regulator
MKIFLADPHPQVRSALHLALSQMPGVSVVSESGDVTQLLAQCAQGCPDLVLLDPELVGPNCSIRRKGVQILTDVFTVIHRICPEAKVVAISSRLEVERETRDAGADGFISKTEPPEVFCQEIARLWLKQEGRSSR